ncbi:MAG: glycosyltransferase family 9 protein [Elusimicrobiota bacterium]|jgi:ADP-heptose:LPS heptosyltransferase
MPLSPADVRLIRLLWLGRLGDVLVATPLFAALRARFPAARIELVTGERGKSGAALVGDVDAVRVLRRLSHPLDDLLLAGALLSERADLLVDLNSAPSRSAWALAALSRARRRVAFARGRGDGLFDELVAAPDEREHMLARYARLAAALDAPYEPRLRVRLGAQEEASVEPVLRALSMGEGLRVGVFAGNFRKTDNRWPEERFVELGRRLLARGLRPVFLAGPGEQEPVQAIAAAVGGGVPTAGPFPVGTTAAFLRRLDLLVTNATGTAHLAAAVGTPTFSVLSAYTRTVWMYPAAVQEGLPDLTRHFSAVSSSWTSCRDVTTDAAWPLLEEALSYAEARRAR